MTTDSAVTEERRYTIRCRRQIVDRCRIFDEWTDPDIRSISAAESAFRENRWVLHSDGTASCPECIDAWENGIDRDVPETDVTAANAETWAAGTDPEQPHS